jgi:hypothetical protein
MIAALFFTGSAILYAQYDFKVLDEKTYDYYVKGDYKNLKKTTEMMLSQGIDYYYLRMRMGILSYNRQLYSSAFKHFSKAIEFSSLDTISREYIYYSFLFSGRVADANLYLKSIPAYKRNNILKSSNRNRLSSVYVSSSASGSDITLYKTNNLYYEAVRSNLSFNAGFESYFLNNFKAVFSYTNFRKSGTVYSASDTSGNDLAFTQHQGYAKVSGFLFPGWEFSGFGHIAFYPDVTTQTQTGNRRLSEQPNTDYLVGFGIAKNGWKLRTGANLTFGNFINSNQIRGEGYLTWLPSGNLNLYFSTGGMYQTDVNWGNTYQLNQEIGFRIIKSIWMESGIITGNSFLYSRNQGSILNNSFQTPAMTLYSNIILLQGKNLSISITPFFTENEIYSWDLNTYTRTGKVSSNSFGGTIKLIYKIK